jgi:hypothetical protein
MLFEEEEVCYTQEVSLPELSAEHELENAYDEIELLGFSLLSPFALTDWTDEHKRLKNNTLKPSSPVDELAARNDSKPSFGRRQIPSSDLPTKEIIPV